MELEGGALYCVQDQGAPPPDEMGTVFVEKDFEGDREIFIREAGRTTQITYNTYDDFAPVYDEVTGRIVWHAMINDRLQIMLHDRTTGETRQLTDTPYNNSNPYVYGDSVVWQAWKGDNWEIMLAENLSGDTPTITQITNNARHDMFPRLFENFITWQAQTRDSWHIVTYDRTTKRYSYVRKTGKGRYENPRFALLFDSRDENGEVRVVGYDVVTDEEIPLTPLSRPVPRKPKTPTEDTGEAALPALNASTTVKTAERRDGGEE